MAVYCNTIKGKGVSYMENNNSFHHIKGLTEEKFLAALEENQPIGATGEIAKGSVIAIESDGIYVDIGGKAPGFMPKNECGLGVITNIKE